MQLFTNPAVVLLLTSLLTVKATPIPVPEKAVITPMVTHESAPISMVLVEKDRAATMKSDFPKPGQGETHISRDQIGFETDPETDTGTGTTNEIENETENETEAKTQTKDRAELSAVEAPLSAKTSPLAGTMSEIQISSHQSAKSRRTPTLSFDPFKTPTESKSKSDSKLESTTLPTKESTKKSNAEEEDKPSRSSGGGGMSGALSMMMMSGMMDPTQAITGISSVVSKILRL